jgi:hypothetical protein
MLMLLKDDSLIIILATNKPRHFYDRNFALIIGDIQ